MKTRIIFFTAVILWTGSVYGQENERLFSRLQGLIDPIGVHFFYVDGIEITSHKLDVEFSAKNCARWFFEFKLKEDDLTNSDSALEFRNYYVYKSQENLPLIFHTAYYFVESLDKDLVAFTFTYTCENDKEFERNFIRLFCNNGIPDSIYHSPEADTINFAGRKVPLAKSCKWKKVNNVQCRYAGQMNWGIHKDLESALKMLNNHYVSTTSSNEGQVISDTVVNVIFEGVETTARKIVYEFTGIRGHLLKREGSNRIIIYFVSAPVRNNFVSCVMSFWESDQINPSGLPFLLEQVMKLK